MSIGAPSFEVYPEPENSRVRLHLYPGGGTVATATYDIQRSDDDKNTWYLIGDQVPNLTANPDVFYDYSAPRETLIYYRIRGTNNEYLDIYTSTYGVQSDWVEDNALCLPGTTGAYAFTLNDDANRTGNRLTNNQASIEGSVNGWGDTSGRSSISKSSNQAADGFNSMRAECVNTPGEMGIITRTVKSGMRIHPNTQYTVLASFRAEATPRTCHGRARFWDASGGALGDSSFVDVTSTTTGWTQSAVTFTSPAGAAYAAVRLSIAGAALSEVHYIDKISFHAGPSTVWTPGREEDLQLLIRLAANDYTPGVSMDFFNKEHAFVWRLNTSGTLTLFVDTDQNGAYEVVMSSTAAITAENGTDLYLRLKLDVDNGASQKVAIFETSLDAVTWTALGATVTQAGAMHIPENDKQIVVGSRQPPESQAFAGRVYYAEVRNLIGGTGTASLIANPDFNRNDAPFTDSMGNVWNLSGPHWTDGTLGGALDFGTSTDKYVRGPLPSIVAPYTVEFWFKSTATTAQRWQVSLNDDNYPRFSGTYFNGSVSRPLLYLNNSNYRYGSASYADGNWHHAAFVVAGTLASDINNAKIYIDGNPEAPGGIASIDAPTSPGSFIRIGHVPGSIDEVRVWNYARTEAEIQGAMNSELLGTEAGLVGYWKLNENQGTTALDSSPNDNHGTFSPNVWFCGAGSALLGATLDEDGNEWLKVVDDPDLNITICRTTDSLESLVGISEQQVGVYYPIDRPDPVVVSLIPQLERYESLGFFFETDADFQAFEAIRAATGPLLLQTCYGNEGLEQVFIRFNSPRQVSRLTTRDKNVAQKRLVTIPAVQVAPPYDIEAIPTEGYGTGLYGEGGYGEG